jgi:hydrogenase maturation protease
VPRVTAAIKPQTLLLGLGNDILSDDAIGLRVVAAVGERLAGREDVTVSQSAEMGLALLDLIVGFDTLVLVDAVQTREAEPGFVHELDGADLKTLPAISPHFLGVGEVLALGRELGLRVPNRVRIFAIEVADPFTVGTALTPALEAALPGLVERVLAAVTETPRPAGTEPDNATPDNANLAE